MKFHENTVDFHGFLVRSSFKEIAAADTLTGIWSQAFAEAAGGSGVAEAAARGAGSRLLRHCMSTSRSNRLRGPAAKYTQGIKVF